MTDFASRFLDTVRPALAAGDVQALAARLQQDYTTADIAQLLEHRCLDVRQVAAISLGLVGQADVVCVLAKALKDPEPAVVQMTEHAMWSIWFRLGGKASEQSFAAGVRLIEEERYEAALEELDTAIEQDPDFAEAHNQSAIALYLLERYEASVACCEQAVTRMPCHFGAIAGMGHGHVHLGQLDAALGCYRRAQLIHPHLPEIGEHIACLEARLSPGSNVTAAPPRPGMAD